MSILSFSAAYAHDHWGSEPALVHAGAFLKLSWRHVERRHPVIAITIEWCAAATLGVGLLIAQLIATA